MFVWKSNKRFKNLFFLAGWYSRTIILDEDDPSRRSVLPEIGHSNVPASLGKPQFIAKDVIDCPAEQIPMAVKVELLPPGNGDRFRQLLRFKTGVLARFLHKICDVKVRSIPAQLVAALQSRQE